MAKPEEVLIVENDQGEVVREFMKDTDAINLYKTMRGVLLELTQRTIVKTLHQRTRLAEAGGGLGTTFFNKSYLRDLGLPDPS